MKIFFVLLSLNFICQIGLGQYVPLAAYDTVQIPKAHSCYSNTFDMGEDFATAYFFSGRLMRIEYNFENEDFTKTETIEFLNNKTLYTFTKQKILNHSDTTKKGKPTKKILYNIKGTMDKKSRTAFTKEIVDANYKEETLVFDAAYLPRRENELRKRVETAITKKDKIIKLVWTKVDSLSNKDIQVYYTNTMLRGKPNIAYYATAALNNKNLNFDAIALKGKRLTPSQYYDAYNKPALIINSTFFSFKDNANLNVVIKDGALQAYNIPSLSYKQRKGVDSIVAYHYPYRSAMGLYSNGTADAAWIYTDTTLKQASAFQAYPKTIQSGLTNFPNADSIKKLSKPWLVKTAVGGGPMLLQNGDWHISANEERLFLGSFQVEHPRTAIGYTKDNRIIILAIEGRNPNAGGATLLEEAEILKQLGCVEALNLDGGGSSCMLINGKPTIKVSDKTGQREVPAVFVIGRK
jgi:hypothetical protein